MKKRKQSDTTVVQVKGKTLRFEHEFVGGGTEQIVDWLVEMMKRIKSRATADEKASEKVDDGEFKGSEET